VPETGIYKLHRDEQVVPAYDQAKTRDSQLVIYNLITNEAVAAAMQSKEGQGVIVNVIDVNASRGGIVRKVIKRG
jgi:precorrin-6B methylase 2